MSEGGFVLTGDGIKAFALLQVKHKLKMEVENPNGPKWRDSPAKQARELLLHAGEPDPGPRKAKVLEAYNAWLTKLGIEKEQA